MDQGQKEEITYVLQAQKSYEEAWNLAQDKLHSTHPARLKVNVPGVTMTAFETKGSSTLLHQYYLRLELISVY